MGSGNSQTRIVSLKTAQAPVALEPKQRTRKSRKAAAGVKVGKVLRRAQKSSVGLSYIWGPKIFFLASCFTGK